MDTNTLYEKLDNYRQELKRQGIEPKMQIQAKLVEYESQIEAYRNAVKTLEEERSNNKKQAENIRQ